LRELPLMLCLSGKIYCDGQKLTGTFVARNASKDRVSSVLGIGFSGKRILGQARRNYDKSRHCLDFIRLR
jgi:hypothetical protein